MTFQMKNQLVQENRKRSEQKFRSASALYLDSGRHQRRGMFFVKSSVIEPEEIDKEKIFFQFFS